jgi:hypothetical protein
LRNGFAAALILLLPACASSDVSRSLGAQCESRSECAERCETGLDYPDGICTTACESDGDCPDSARCVDKEGGICLFACEVDPDCEFLGTGWTCKNKDRRENTQEEVLVCIGD